MIDGQSRDKVDALLIIAIGGAQGLAVAMLTRLPSDAWMDANPFAIRLLWGGAIFLTATAQWLMPHRHRKLFWGMLAAVALLIVVAAWSSAGLSAGRDMTDEWLPALGFLTWLALMTLGEFAATAERRMSDYTALYALTTRNALMPFGAGLLVLLALGLMHIWSGLFKLLGFEAFAQLIVNRWLLFPLLGFAFGFGVATLLERAALIEGARRLFGAIGAALLPLAAFIVIAFVAGLAVAGPEPLWKTGYATHLMLLLAGAFAVFLNVAHDDGRNLLCLPRPLLIVARLGAALIPVLVGLSIYSLSLRIAQYGWTVDRIFGVLALTLAAVAGLGYSAASLRPRAALPSLARANLVALGVALVIGLSVTTGLLSPAKIAARDQVARILDGRTEFSKIDWFIFAAELGQPGRSALEQLAQSEQVAEIIQQAADRALNTTPDNAYFYNRQITKEFAAPSDYKLLSTNEPADRDLIERIDADASIYQAARCTKDCYILTIDLDGDGIDEMIAVRDSGALPAYKMTDAGWIRIGRLNSNEKPAELLEKLRRANATAVMPTYHNVMVEGQLMQFTADTATK